MATIGYGKMSPVGIAANTLVTVEALAGFCFIAVMTGIIFTKFSRPTARLLFSDVAVVCPYNGVPHLMLRLANERGNRIVDANVHLTLLRLETSHEGHKMRRFHDMRLARSHVPILQLTWTVMHPLDEKSPLYNMKPEMLKESDAEIIISLTGLDETLSQTIHARYSYLAEEILYGYTFEDIMRRLDDRRMEINYSRFHSTKKIS
jgi:inward rectifier potassium channel